MGFGDLLKKATDTAVAVKNQFEKHQAEMEAAVYLPDDTETHGYIDGNILPKDTNKKKFSIDINNRKIIVFDDFAPKQFCVTTKKRWLYEIPLNDVVSFKIKSSEITASHDGRITLIGDYHAGDYVQAGSSLCSLVPQTDELKVVLYIPEKEISKIEIGQKTEYIFDALPYTEYGKITGEILSVSEDSIINESAQTRFYIAKASISKQVLENNKGEKREVKTGMLVQAKTISGSKKAIVWLMEKLNFMD